VCCFAELFNSAAKFESGTGWPSYFKPISKLAVLEETDNAFNMERIKVTCNTCGAHLGHVFKDGAKPTVQRYCTNAASLIFEEKQ